MFEDMEWFVSPWPLSFLYCEDVHYPPKISYNLFHGLAGTCWHFAIRCSCSKAVAVGGFTVSLLSICISLIFVKGVAQEGLSEGKTSSS